jgi:hypothetical protein
MLAVVLVPPAKVELVVLVVVVVVGVRAFSYNVDIYFIQH